ncbi:hypothetical protein Poli38472_006803 [Pythium oligandrum]|uniref:Uncharacterized protein n=1 Tax=Pythium oligandrum TaxID=41045 RepID=A0A8K1C5H7_PYTOL|nr:hypothetical protein Poli38472_006803 [Pythium oligandrum]|eukprot:TMW56793.1 hypothetical protein Poli38472_006803 [Pythium oligandrum]
MATMMMAMPSSRLAAFNAALYVTQLVITGISFSRPQNEAQYDTLITPAAYAFSIWSVIYVLTLSTVVTDLFFPAFSIYNNAAKPDFLRACFALSCIFNFGWVVLFHGDLVNLATVDITLLWLSLLPIYLFVNFERDERPFSWRPYVFSELSIRLYFSWVSAATLISWTITLQGITGGFLSLSTYLMLLSVLIVIATVGVVYGRDSVIGLVAVWALNALAHKDLGKLDVDDSEKLLRIQAAATLAASVTLTLILVSALERIVFRVRSSREWRAYLKISSETEAHPYYGT